MTREDAILKIKDIGCYDPAAVDKAQWQNGRIHLYTDEGLSFDFPVDGTLDAFIKADDIKAVLIGSSFYQPGILSLELGEDFDFGSGRIRIFTSKNCMVQAALEQTNKMRASSCGICTFCREGAFQIASSLTMMTKPGCPKDQLDFITEIGEAMKISCACPIGEENALPALTAISAFRPEFEAHCGAGSCPAGECSSFSRLYIDPMKCQGSGDCMDVCPADAIEGRSGFISMIDEFECTKCGKCVEACENGAIKYASGHMPKLPDRLTKVGRFRR